jgi:hypothetical protein
MVFKHQNKATRTHPLMMVEGESPSSSTCPVEQAIVEIDMVQVRMVPLPCSSCQMQEIDDEIDGDVHSRGERVEALALERVYIVVLSQLVSTISVSWK